jgi:hypothetical protein
MLKQPMTDRETAIRTLRFVIGFFLILMGVGVLLPELIHFEPDAIVPGLFAFVVTLVGIRCLMGLGKKESGAR